MVKTIHLLRVENASNSYIYNEEGVLVTQKFIFTILQININLWYQLVANEQSVNFYQTSPQILSSQKVIAELIVVN